MVTLTRPLDTPEKLDGTIRIYKKAAEDTGSVAGHLKTLGTDLTNWWWGAAERMTSREITAAAGFFKKISESFDAVVTALGKYKGEIERANRELKALEGTMATEPSYQLWKPGLTFPNSPLLTPSTKPSPSTSSSGPPLLLSPDTDPRVKAIWDSLAEPASTCRTAIVNAASHVASGSGTILTVNIGKDLPFQRDSPLVPGPGSKPSALPGDVNSKTKSPGVEQLQELLQARGWRIDVTGKYDDRTRYVVAAFQREKHIKPANGVVNQATWDAIWNKPITGWS
jgi:hypothetical protein